MDIAFGDKYIATLIVIFSVIVISLLACLSPLITNCFASLFMEQGFWKEHLRGRPYHIRSVTALLLDLSFNVGK